MSNELVEASHRFFELEKAVFGAKEYENRTTRWP
jgi:hypothetical protein